MALRVTLLRTGCILKKSDETESTHTSAMGTREDKPYLFNSASVDDTVVLSSRTYHCFLEPSMLGDTLSTVSYARV